MPLTESPFGLTSDILSAETAGGISVAEAAIGGVVILGGIWIARKGIQKVFGSKP